VGECENDAIDEVVAMSEDEPMSVLLTVAVADAVDESDVDPLSDEIEENVETADQDGSGDKLAVTVNVTRDVVVVVDVKERLVVPVGDNVTSAVTVKLFADDALTEEDAEVDNVLETVVDVDASAENELAGDGVACGENEAEEEGDSECVRDGRADADDDGRGLSVARDVREESNDGAVVARLDTEDDPVKSADTLGLPLVEALLEKVDSADDDASTDPDGNPLELVSGETVPVVVDKALTDADTLAVLVTLADADLDALAHWDTLADWSGDRVGVCD
jgi:hypothetical protein